MNRSTKIINVLYHVDGRGHKWVFTWDDEWRSFTNLLLTIQGYWESGDLDVDTACRMIEMTTDRRIEYAKANGLSQ